MAVKATATITLVRVLDGADGKRTYFAYADSADGTENFSFDPGTRKYMGMFSGEDRDALQEAVDAPIVEGDGRNLLKGLKGSPATDYLEYKKLDNSTKFYIQFNTGTNVPIIRGVDLTFSFDFMEIIPNDNYNMAFGGGNSSNSYLSDLIYNSPIGKHVERTRLSKLLNYPDNSRWQNRPYFGYRLRIEGKPYHCWFGKCKLELGSTATPWTPAPEDTLAELDEKLNTPSSYQWSLIKGTDGKDGIDGIDGTDGKDGTDGQSVSEVTTQYYLSTSKTSVTGGSWDSELPAWKKNTYIWTRLKIDYINPTKTEYTTEVLDTVNNALNEVYNSGTILPSQKPQLLIKLAEIVEEYKVLDTEDNKKLDEWTAYQSAYTSLSSTLTVLTNDMSATSELDPANFKMLNETYATAYNNLSKAIESALKSDIGILQERVSTAETKIKDDAIINLVTQTELYKKSILNFYDGSDPEPFWINEDNIIGAASDSATFFIPIPSAGEYVIDGLQTDLLRTGYITGKKATAEVLVLEPDRETILPRTISVLSDVTYIVVQVGALSADDAAKELTITSVDDSISKEQTLLERISTLEQRIEGFVASISSTNEKLTDFKNDEKLKKIVNYLAFLIDENDIDGDGDREEAYVELGRMIGNENDSMLLRQWRDRIEFDYGGVKSYWTADEIKVGQTTTETNAIGRYEFKTPSKTVLEAWYHEV